MADQQNNFISKFVPKSHFFTDPATISQTAEQAFGPASESEFRITSSFNISLGDNKVYAICRGVVLVQPQAGSTDKVNVIMRPYTQPIQGFNIKYFIYRGLSLIDFFTGNLVKAADGTTSDFINNINASFLAFHSGTDPGGAVPDFLASYIGFDPAHQTPEMLLSDLFFKQSEYVDNGGTSEESGLTAFELPNVAMGSSLGTFAAGECGIDVVLNYGDYKLPVPNDEFVFDMAYARAPKASIMTSVTNSDVQNKVIKEQIFQFLDVAAYFGFHAIDTGTVIMNVSGAKVNKKGTDIYDLMVSKFFTKNRLYIYIQSDRTRSYNFYGNYAISDTNSNSLKIGITVDSLAERTYGTNGWPLIIDESSQTHSETDNTLYLQFVTDNNVNTMLYGQVAEISNAQSNNFCGPDSLRVEISGGTLTNTYTNGISIINSSVAVADAKLNISTFNIFLYQGVVYTYVASPDASQTGTTQNKLESPDFFDDVFGLIKADSLFKNGGLNDYSAMSSARINLINHYVDKSQLGISAVQTTIVSDTLDTGLDLSPSLQRVTYVTEAVDILNSAISVTNALTNNTNSSASASEAASEDKSYHLPEPYYYTLTYFTDSGQVVNGVALKTKDDTIPNKIILGITQNENTLIKGLITDEMSNSRLFLLDLFQTNLTSPENIIFQKYQLALVAEQSGHLRIYMPSEDIFIYSLDRNYHFSIGYSQYMPSPNYTTEYFIVNPAL
ncbi:hypothetical protein PQ469_14365 [Mucilaginibacter sp. KACC 22773]|uniref:hypothetical protein n=1 Tax=Mucilaginibacter sp. KACC 22773 TaxID=3025671 RepID=UPI0023657DCC|nr:hypothetical protein [Mucilaginibacter sp. KACC 22773]WDF81192.1 hypothetical protein PQ469_14365 [Mucilaginibacter sp. KACC 22773]